MQTIGEQKQNIPTYNTDKVNKYLLKELLLFLFNYSILREHIKNNLLEKQSFLQKKIDQYRTELATLKTTCTAKDISIQKLQSQVSVYLVWFGWFLVFYATFNSISVISWQSVLLVENL
jgi:cell division protein FtsB